MSSDGSTKRMNLFRAFVLWRVELDCRWCCGQDLLFASVIAICFVFSIVFFSVFFRAVRVASSDMDFLLSFGCFLFDTPTEEGNEKPRHVHFLQSVPSNGSFLLLLSSFSLACVKFRMRCTF